MPPPPTQTPNARKKPAERALKLLTRDASNVLVFSGSKRRWRAATASGRSFRRTAGLPMDNVIQDLLTGPFSRAPGAAKMQVLPVLMCNIAIPLPSPPGNASTPPPNGLPRTGTPSPGLLGAF